MMRKLLALFALCLLGSCTEDIDPPAPQPPPMGPLPAMWDNFNWDEGVWQ